MGILAILGAYGSVYLAEGPIACWLERLKAMEAFAGDRVSTIRPGHGAAGDLELIPGTAVSERLRQSSPERHAKSAELEILGKYAGYRVQQFLTAFSIPAFFPAASSA